MDMNLQVFISSAMSLSKDRRTAANAVRSLGMFTAWMWEDQAYPGRFNPDKLFLQKASEADALVLLVQDTLTTSTRREYEVSVKNGRYQLIFFKKLKPSQQMDSTATEFKASLQSGKANQTYWSYSNASELRTVLIRGLQAAFVAFARTGMQAPVANSTTAAETYATPQEDARENEIESLVDLFQSIEAHLTNDKREEAAGGILFAGHMLLDNYFYRDCFSLMETYLQRWPEVKDTTSTEILLLSANAISHLGNNKEAEKRERRAIDQAIENKDIDLERAARQALGATLSYQGRPREARKEYTTALKLAKGLDDSISQAQLHHNMAVLDIEAGKLEKAEKCLKDIIAWKLSLGLVTQAAYSQSTLAAVFAQQGEFDKASSAFTDLIALGKQAKDPLILAHAYVNRGTLSIDMEQFRIALKWFSMALGQLRRCQELKLRVLAYEGLGQAYFRLNRHSLAEIYFKRLVTIYRKQENRPAEAMALQNRGAMLLKLGRLALSNREYRHAVKLFNEVENYEWRSISHLGILRSEESTEKRSEESLELLTSLETHWIQEFPFDQLTNAIVESGDWAQIQRAIRLEYTATGNHRSGKSRWSWRVAMLASLCRDYGHAIIAERLYRRALRLYMRQSQPEMMGQLYSDLGVVLVAQDKFSEAICALRKAMVIARSRKNSVLLMNVLHNLGEVHRRTSTHKRSLMYFRQSFAIAESLKSIDGIVQSLASIGLLYTDMSLFGRAHSWYRRLMKFGRIANSRLATAFATSGFADIAFCRNNYRAAEQGYKDAFRLFQGLKEWKYAGVALANSGISSGRLGRHRLAARMLIGSTVYSDRAKDSYSMLIASRQLAQEFAHLGRVRDSALSLLASAAYRSFDAEGFVDCLREVVAILSKRGAKEVRQFSMTVSGLLKGNNLTSYRVGILDAISIIEAQMEEANRSS